MAIQGTKGKSSKSKSTSTMTAEQVKQVAHDASPPVMPGSQTLPALTPVPDTTKEQKIAEARDHQARPSGVHDVTKLPAIFTTHMEGALKADEDNKRLPVAIAEDLLVAHPVSAGANNRRPALCDLPVYQTVLKGEQGKNTPAWRIVESNADKYTSGDVTSTYWNDTADNTQSSRVYQHIVKMCEAVETKGAAEPAPYKLPTNLVANVDVLTADYLNKLLDAKRLVPFKERFKNRINLVRAKIGRASDIARAKGEIESKWQNVTVTFEKDEDGEASRDKKCVRVYVVDESKNQGESYYVTVGEMLGWNLDKVPDTVTGIAAFRKSSRKTEGGNQQDNQATPVSPVPVISNMKLFEQYTAEYAAWCLNHTKDGTADALILEQIGTAQAKNENKDLILSLDAIIRTLDPHHDLIKNRAAAIRKERHEASEAARANKDTTQAAA